MDTERLLSGLVGFAFGLGVVEPIRFGNQLFRDARGGPHHRAGGVTRYILFSQKVLDHEFWVRLLLRAGGGLLVSRASYGVLIREAGLLGVGAGLGQVAGCFLEGLTALIEFMLRHNHGKS